MKSSRPYLLRAIHEWIVDNDCTPFLLVNAAHPGVEVPSEYIENDKIILNIGPAATQQLALGDEAVTFQARFGGRARQVLAPMGAILAVYARENGQGMLFTDEAEGTDDSGAASGETDSEGADVGEPADEGRPARRPSLKVIK